MAQTIHIVDDDASFRTALGRLIEVSGFTVAGHASGAEILASLGLDEPGCILLDLQMPDIDGLDLQQRLAEKAPLLPIVFLTGHGNVEATVRAMKAGAEDFLEKPVSHAALLAAIERALLRYETRRAEHDRATAYAGLAARLTPREAQVFDQMVHGKRNKEIAFAQGTSERTVKAHRRSVMEKLKVRSFAEAVSIAERLGLLSPGDDRRTKS